MPVECSRSIRGSLEFPETIRAGALAVDWARTPRLELIPVEHSIALPADQREVGLGGTGRIRVEAESRFVSRPRDESRGLPAIEVEICPVVDGQRCSVFRPPN